MPADAGSQTVGVVIAMPSEMTPFRRAAGLQPEADGDGRRYVGTVGDNDVVAVVSGMGTALAATATERLLDGVAVDRVVMIGICGGVDVPVGTMIVPAVVIHGVTDAEHRPAPLSTLPADGVLWTSDSMTGEGDLGWLRERGIVGVDMETAAVGAVCEARGIPWSAIRVVSDPVGPPGADEEIFGLAHLDGSPNFRAVARYLFPRFWRIGRLLRLAKGAKQASNAAANALHNELTGVNRGRGGSGRGFRRSGSSRR